MEVTAERIDELIEGLKQVARLNREREGFSGAFMPVAIIVGPNGEHAVQPTPFTTQEEKAINMRALSQAARRMHVVAIVLVNDTYHVKIEEFAKRYGIPEGLNQKEFDEAYWGILDAQFDGTLANVPKDLVSDALLVAMKGPLFQQRIFFMPYHEGVGDSIRWDEEQPEHDAEILLLDDWWDKTPAN
jgi:hypothetical protein